MTAFKSEKMFTKGLNTHLSAGVDTGLMIVRILKKPTSYAASSLDDECSNRPHQRKFRDQPSEWCEVHTI